LRVAGGDPARQPIQPFPLPLLIFSTICWGIAGSKAKDVHFEHLSPPGAEHRTTE
jgi:hypothetical protein